MVGCSALGLHTPVIHYTDTSQKNGGPGYVNYTVHLLISTAHIFPVSENLAGFMRRSGSTLSESMLVCVYYNEGARTC